MVAPIPSYLLTMLVFFSSAFVQGVIGFGFNILTVPFLTILADAKTAVSVVSIPSQMNCVLLALRPQSTPGAPFAWQPGLLVPILLTGAVGTIAGAGLLVALDPSLALTGLGGLVLLFVFTDGVRRNWQPNPSHERPLALVVGLVTGLLSGLAGVSGPTLVPYLHSRKLDKHQFVTYLNMLFLCFGCYQWIVFFFLGLYTWPRVLEAAGFIPAALLGIALGARVRNRVSAAFFNRLVLLILFVTGLDLIRRGLHLF
jgi:uncharacterized membrane protein YfcA